jgi:5-methylcytosine-specific restriction endonuclease McrA
MGVGTVAQEWAKAFYNSKAWKKCRDAYKDSTIDQLCEKCREPGDEVHHKTWLTPENINDPYITLAWDNLELLCHECHSIEHNRKHDALRDDVMFDARGDLVKAN